MVGVAAPPAEGEDTGYLSTSSIGISSIALLLNIIINIIIDISIIFLVQYCYYYY